jgi:uncharacterized caspase-like protein
MVGNVSRKFALIIGNSQYEDQNLAQLATPDSDVNALRAVLQEPRIGGFDQVTMLVNQPVAAVRRAISAFFVERGREDLLLLYFSGHGIRDDSGQLYLAVKDTEHNLLRGTSIPSTFITEEMDHSRSRRQVLILDCCHSGAFSRGMKGASGDSVGTAAAFEGTGAGRVVLTATDSTQYAWEGDRVVGQAENSVFTRYLIQGLHSGEPDTDADGKITLDELYNYIYAHVVQETPRQTPGKWSYGQQGEIVIAMNPRPVLKPAELPSELRQTMDDLRPWVREGAINELARLAGGSQRGLALAAQEALRRMANDDSRRVADAASQALAAPAGTQPAVEAAKTADTPQAATEQQAANQVADERPAPEKAGTERLATQRTAPERPGEESPGLQTTIIEKPVDQLSGRIPWIRLLAAAGLIAGLIWSIMAYQADVHVRDNALKAIYTQAAETASAQRATLMVETLNTPAIMTPVTTTRALISKTGNNFASDLVESWDVSADGLNWTLSLAQNVRLADDSRFTSFAVEGLLYNWDRVASGQATVEIVDDYTLNIQLNAAISSYEILDELSKYFFTTRP